MRDVPSTPLEGEWIVCASSKIGCKGGMDGRAYIDKVEEADQVPACWLAIMLPRTQSLLMWNSTPISRQ